jgi:hypothetical protein
MRKAIDTGWFPPSIPRKFEELVKERHVSFENPGLVSLQKKGRTADCL